MSAIYYCFNCGTQIDPTWITCPNCGTSLKQIPIITQETRKIPITKQETRKAKVKRKKIALEVIIIFGLIIGGVTVLAIYWDDWFPEETPDKTPTKLLFLEMDFDDREVYDSNDEVEISFKKDNRFILRDKYGKFEGDYEFTKDKNGKGELNIFFDNRLPKEWKFKLKDKGHFEGIRDNKDNGGKYRWLQSISVQTNHLFITIEDSDNVSYYYKKGDTVDIIFQGDDKFTWYYKEADLSGEYDYKEDKYKKDKFLILDYDKPEDTWYLICEWHITMYNETHFTGTECSYHNSGSYEWVT